MTSNMTKYLTYRTKKNKVLSDENLEVDVLY